MSGVAEQDYFTDGITEDVVTDLSAVENLSVAAPSSTQIFRGSAVRPEQIAAELRVRYILEGSVRRSGQSIRIAARLVDGKNGRQVWAERYDRELVNIFELQSEIAGAIVGALKLSFRTGSGETASGRGTKNVEAHEFYLRGRALLREMTRRSVDLSQDMFEKAVALDPNYARAYAGLADAASMLGHHYEASAAELESAIYNSKKALSIDPASAEAHCSLGRAYSVTRQSERAEEEFLLAIELDPHLQEAHFYRGLTHFGRGRINLAEASLRRAFELADQDLQTGMMLMSSLLEDQPESVGPLARHLYEVAQRRIRLNPYDESAAYVGAMALHALGDRDEALRWARLAAAFDVQDARTTYNLACTFSLLGEVDEALSLLRETLRLGCSDGKTRWIKDKDPDLALARQDPRFLALFSAS